MNEKNMSPARHVQTRLTETEYRELEHFAQTRKISLNLLVREAILDKIHSTTHPSDEILTTSEKKYFREFLDILRSGDVAAVRSLRCCVDMISRPLVRERKR